VIWEVRSDTLSLPVAMHSLEQFHQPLFPNPGTNSVRMMDPHQQPRDHQNVFPPREDGIRQRKG
jgi:hypothetical protein